MRTNYYGESLSFFILQICHFSNYKQKDKYFVYIVSLTNVLQIYDPMNNLFKQFLPGFGSPYFNERTTMKGNVVAILRDERNNVRRITQPNIIVTTGDQYYAQKAAGESPTSAFSIFELGIGGAAPSKSSNRSAITTPVSGSQIAFSAGYPKTNDTDPLNTGGGININTFKGFWGQGVATANGIDRIIITVSSPGASAPLLMYALFSSSFNKGAFDTLTVFVNHTFLGV